jgi:hypothetical protein
MTTKITSVSEDQMQMLLIVVLVGAILYMLTQRSGGICSLVNPRERFVIGAADCKVGEWFSEKKDCYCPQNSELSLHATKELKRCLPGSGGDCSVGDWFDRSTACLCPRGSVAQFHNNGKLKRCLDKSKCNPHTKPPQICMTGVKCDINKLNCVDDGHGGHICDCPEIKK